jgi:ribosome-associated protein
LRASKFKSQTEISREEIEEKLELKENAKKLSSDQVVVEALKLALDQKALDPVVFNLSNSYSIAERIMIVSGTSPRHVKGISDKILEGLNKIGIKAERMEGYNSGEWVILDYGNLLIHMFFEPTRQYYALDDLLSPNPKVKFGEELETQIRSFKTGLHQIL